jgi:ribosomal protein S15P/S13E
MVLGEDARSPQVLGQRKRLLEYLKGKDEAKFNQVVADLNIRYKNNKA